MKEKLKSLKIFHWAIILGLILAYFFLGNINSLDKLKLPKVDNRSLVFIIIPALSIVASNLLFKYLIGKIDSKLTFDEKFKPYQTALLVRWSILEVAAFIIILVKPDFILFGILLILYLFLTRPTENSITTDLKLN